MSNTHRSVAVLGADTTVGATVVTGLADSAYRVVAIGDDESFPAGATAFIDAGPLRQPPVGELVALDAATWVSAAEDPMRRALHVLQRAHGCLRDGGGRVVVLLPSLVMSGAAGVAAWAAAAEGYRSLAKAAARAWGDEGIAVQCVLVPTGIDRPGLQPPALSRVPELAPVVAALLDARLDAVTGLTLAVDGGVWMTS